MLSEATFIPNEVKSLAPGLASLTKSFARILIGFFPNIVSAKDGIWLPVPDPTIDKFNLAKYT